jgi:hypothetical protein
MRGQHVAPAERAPWKTVALAVADWIVGAGLRLCFFAVLLFVVLPMAVRRRISGPRPAPAASRR